MDGFGYTFQDVSLLITGPASIYFDISLDVNKIQAVTNTTLLHRGNNDSVFSNYSGYHYVVTRNYGLDSVVFSNLD